MGLTLTYQEGDGVNDDLVQAAISLPDDQSTITVEGVLKPAGSASGTIPKTALASPANPGSGSVYFIVQVDPSNAGATTLKQSTSGFPTPDAQSGNAGLSQKVIYQQRLDSTSPADDSLAGNDTIPEPPLGSP